MTEKNKVVLVTGSSQGIGKATALSFYRSGDRVVFTGRSSQKIKRIKKDLKDPARAFMQTADLRSANSCRRLVEKIVRKWGRIDILVNNCGGLPARGRFLDLAEKAWRDSFELNLLTAVTMSRRVIPFMQKHGGGRIIFVSSFVALQPGSFNPHYSAMKMALLNLTKHLSLQFAQDNILVNAVLPGNIHTEGWETYLLDKSRQERRDLSSVQNEEHERVVKAVPLKRFGRPEEVAELIRFLCSETGSFVTGASLMIDGGILKGV